MGDRSRRSPRRRREATPRWYLLIHQLPPQPLYLRAKIRQRLAKVGAVALKNAVYVLPRLEDCLEDFEWIAQEAIAGGGEAYVCEADFPQRGTSSSLIQRFRRDREADYTALAESMLHWSRTTRRRSGSNPPEEDLPERLARSRKRFEEIARIDFFRAKGRDGAEKLLETLERRAASRREQEPPPRARVRNLSRRTWVTRKGIKVDRIASAWLVRRFLDPRARFRFLNPKTERPRPGEITFDMVGGDFTHEGDRCTFETILRAAGPRDPALLPVAEIVHDIDLKDGKFARPETKGIEQVLAGILRVHPSDEERLDRGFALFDELYESFRRKKPAMLKGVSK